MFNQKLREARILIVDDQEANVAVLENLLERGGYTRLLGITDSRQVVKLFTEFDPDLIILDLVMPHLDGFMVMDQLRPLIPPDTYMPILILTADINPEARQRALSSGAKDFLTKPIDVIEVGLRIRNLLETRFLHLQIQNRSQILNDMVLERTAELTQVNEGLAQLNSQLQTEINERTQIEKALSESERQMQALLASLDDIVVECNAKGVYLHVWTVKEDLLIGPKVDLIGHRVTDILPEETAQKFLHAIQQVFLTSTSTDLEYPLRTPTEERWFSARFNLIKSSRGADSTVCILIRDVTRRKVAESRVLHENARAEALLNIASQLNAQLNLESVYTTVCEAAVRALNTSAATIYLFNAQQNVFEYASGYGFPPNYDKQTKPIPAEIYKLLISNANEPYVLDIQVVPEVFDYVPVLELDMHSITGVNLLRDKQLVGNLALYTFERPAKFTANDLALLQGLADQAVLAIANARLYEDSQRRLQNIQALHRMDMAISGSLELSISLKIILEELTRHLQVDAANIFIMNAYMNTLEFAVGHGFNNPITQKTQIRLGDGLTGRIALERQPLHISDELENHLEVQRFNLLAPEKFRGYYGLPLIAKAQVQGVIEIFHRAPLKPDTEWLEFIETIAGQAAIAIENITLFNKLQRSNTELGLAYDITLEGWSRAMDLRDRETEGHTQRVAEMTVQLGQSLGLSDQEIVNARRGALLHDMGKLGIPDSILLKPGKLTDEEWEIMKKHPTYAYEMLSPISYLRPALDIPYCHHEKWDGTGYPRGLKGESIPIAARIFSVADVWDALRSDRPYRKAWSREKVIAYIREHKEDYFDPKVVDAFLSIIDQFQTSNPRSEVRKLLFDE